jgi:hypothetical protein
MPGLSDHKMEIVRMLVETAPDKVVGGLHNALVSAEGDTALAGVRKLVECELADRRLRNAILSPVAPLFIGDGKSATRLSFPLKALPLLWRALKDQAPMEVAQAARLLVDFRPMESSPEPFDTLVKWVADGLRSERPTAAYAAAAEVLNAARPGGAEAMAACLDLSPIVRDATLHLPEWIARTTEESAAAARVHYKDSVGISDDAGPRLFEMMAAQMAEPWSILRIVSAVMDRPTERYLASSELSVFAERLMDEIDANLAHVAHFDLNGGAAAGKRAGETVELITQQIAEIENAVDLGREGGWGGRVQKQKKSLAAVVEGRLREIEKVVNLALPSHIVRVARARKSLPRLEGVPDARAADRGTTLLTFTEVIRTSANYGGFASTRAKVIEKVGEILDNYVEDALTLVRDHEVEDREAASGYLKYAADFVGLIREPRAGDIVRRRLVAALAAPKPLDIHIE